MPLFVKPLDYEPLVPESIVLEFGMSLKFRDVIRLVWISKQNYFKQDVEQYVPNFLNFLILGAIRKKCLSTRGSQSLSLLTRWLMKETSNYGGLSLLSGTRTTSSSIFP
jgi:hypothetical protein